MAEEAAQFEHRDLHWGNLLVRRVPKAQRARCMLRRAKCLTEPLPALTLLV